jgi:hypothetical protein
VVFEGVPHAPEFTAIWCDIASTQVEGIQPASLLAVVSLSNFVGCEFG